MLREMSQSIASSPQSIVKKILLCSFSAILLSLPFSFGRLWILAWFGFAPLFFSLRNKSKLQAFLLAYLCGFVLWWLTIYWLVHVTLVGTLVLILYLSLYFACFGFLFSYITHYTLHITQILALPSLWALLEYLRSHLLTGFPWAFLGYSQYLNLPIIQSADITGAWGVSFAVMLGNVIIYRISGNGYRVSGRRKGRVGYAGEYLAVLFLVLVFFYGFFKLSRIPYPASRIPLKISLIQPNIPQELKWDPANNDYIIRQYLRLTAAAAKGAPDLVVWPEAALPVVLEEEPAYLRLVQEAMKENQSPLLFGTVTCRGKLYYNSALLLDEGGEVSGRYDKLHLVPFGEYIPLREKLPFLQTIVPIGEIAPGNDYMVFSYPPSTIHHPPSVKFSVLICFEDLFPELSRQFVLRGADFLVNITNDAWYKKTSAAEQHLQASVLRSVENRRYLVRAANTGVSAFISPLGKVISRVQGEGGRDIFAAGFRQEEILLPRQQRLSFYTRHGDIFILACFLFFICGIIPARKRPLTAPAS